VSYESVDRVCSLGGEFARRSSRPAPEAARRLRTALDGHRA
jgi:hypothetical protein